MKLDGKMVQMALKMKNLVLIDLSFPESPFDEFSSLYEQRFLHLPCQKEMAIPFAAGMSSMGKQVVIYGAEVDINSLCDTNLNVKVLKESSGGSFEGLDSQIREFGPAVLLIPEREGSSIPPLLPPSPYGT
ncbi:MAG: hypothetical protein WC846_01150 [Candidatus Gracilibacteria bacterium]